MSQTESIALFNGQHGFLEAYVRGQQDRMLSSADYMTLTQCARLDDFVLSLNSTYLGDTIKDMKTVSPNSISNVLTNRLASELLEIKSHAEDPLATFIDYLTYSYMIDNVLLIVLGTVNGRGGDELLTKCHPLGIFPTIGALTSCDTIADLYDMILESPVAKFFETALHIDSAEEDAGTAIHSLASQNIEILRAKVFKAYIEDFYDFCKDKIGGHTWETMEEILKFEGDHRSINIALDSLGSELTREQKLGLLPEVGHLYPYIHPELVSATEVAGVSATLIRYEEYTKIFDVVQMNPAKTLTDAFYEAEVAMHKRLWLNQFNFGVYYSWLRLREQEIRNLVWITDCIINDQREMINHYVPIW